MLEHTTSKYKKANNRLIIIQMITIYILSIVITIMITAVHQRSRYETKIAELTSNHEQELTDLCTELQTDYESQISELKYYYEYGGDVSQIEREAEYIAKVLYGTARNHADSDKKAVIWCILNRVEDHGHPSTIAQVCEQPKQWMGYSEDNPVLDNLYELALTELKIWHTGDHRPMSNEYIYLTWSSSEILLRDTYEENKSTNYWRMK